MPLNILRLNAKKSHPNDRIVFIKPLKGSDEAKSREFLERIAAQCLPIMKEHHLSVTTLEEYEPNREFAGRNFNAGECIQLVLRSRNGNGWLPFNMVQMVMMHELAHCKQMNHSRAFWAVRNDYAARMEGLWSRGYTGEGMWGRGQHLGSHMFVDGLRQDDGEHMPLHLCGGVYRSRNRKRKRDWRADKEKRILKKFGANGVALGADEAVRERLERGKATLATPRQAGSKRGRELRAAAALARFSQPAAPPPLVTEGHDDDSEFEDDPSEVKLPDALDINGRPLRDTKGGGLIKVEEDDGIGGMDFANELQQMNGFFGSKTVNGQQSAESVVGRDDKSTVADSERATAKITTKTVSAGISEAGLVTSPELQQPSQPHAKKCPCCQEPTFRHWVLCHGCAHVLDETKVPGAWQCVNKECLPRSYRNADVCEHCALCGEAKVDWEQVADLVGD